MKINNPLTTMLFLAISLALFFLLVMPRYDEYNVLKASLTEKRAQHQDKSDYYKQLVNIVTEIELKKESLDKINNALPPTDSVAKVIYFLQEEAEKNNLDIRSVTFSKTIQPQGKKFKETSFTVSLFGDYKNFKKFISILDNSARIFEMEIISFENEVDPSGEQSQSTSHYRLDIKTHSY